MKNAATKISPAPEVREKNIVRLWLRMLPVVAMVERRLRSRFREHFDITLPQFDVLAKLDQAQEPLNMTTLSRQLLVSGGNVTGVVDRLVRDGYVVRRPSPADSRVQLVALSDQGREAFSAMARAHAGWLAELFEDLGDAEVEQINELLTHAKSAIYQQTHP